MVRTLAILALVCAAVPAWASDYFAGPMGCQEELRTGDRCIPLLQSIMPDTSWHLLTQSFGGAVSLITGLTKEECEAAQYRLYTHPSLWWQEHMASTVYQLPGDIRTAECFQ